MLPIKLRIPELQIADKEPGLYCMTPLAGSGKTELSCIFKAYQAYGARVAAYSYYDYVEGIDIKSTLDPDKFDIALLDRYDLYYGHGLSEILLFIKVRPLLLDCKRKIDFIDTCAGVLFGRNKDTVFVY